MAILAPFTKKPSPVLPAPDELKCHEVKCVKLEGGTYGDVIDMVKEVK